MDERDLFRDFRRDVASPSDDARRRAYARLTSAIEGHHGHRSRILGQIRRRPGRTALVLATVTVAAVAALFVSTPWQGSPGFLERAEAALTPPAGTVLHTKFEVTTTTPAFSCTVTRGPYETWIDQAPPHKFRMLLNDSAGLDPRAIACGRGAPSEVGGTLDTGDFPPGLKLPVDLAAWLRERISDGTAYDEGKKEVDGRTVELIRLDGPNDCPVPGCERDPVLVYVDPETFHPVQIESPHGYIDLPGGVVRFDIVTRYLTFEYLPGTDENRALADIRHHPNAIGP